MKGISNLIAAVLLVAVTISVVSIFARWAPGIVQDATQGTGDQVRDSIDCNTADLEIQGAKYYGSDNETTVVARNTGRINLSDVRFEAYRSITPMNSTKTYIERGRTAAENISTSSRPSDVRAISLNCTNAEDTSEDIE